MIEIKDIQGNQLLSVPITQSCQKVEELMTADYVQLSWNSDLSDVIPVGSYIDINGEKYRLLEPYSPTQKDELEFTYTPKFESRVRAWGKMPFFFYSGISKEPDWTLTSNPADFMRCVCDSIRNESGESWTYSIDASLSASASLSFSSLDILSGLNQIASAFETEWFADKETNTIYLGRFSHGEEAVLEVGKNISVPSVQSIKEGFYTRFYAFGSTRNITQDYNGANTNNLVNKRLTLDPIKYPNGYKDIRGGLREGEIFSKVLIFENVYPSAKLSISDVRNRLMYRLDESGDKIQLGTDERGNPIYDQYSIWYFRIEGFEFDFNNVIEGLTPSISFQSGALNGREFEVIYYDKAKKITTSDGIVFEVQAGDYEICFLEENNLIIPSMTGLVPSDGDDVVLFNIEMPSEYIQSAYEELEIELDKEIAKLTSDLNNYSFKSNPVAFSENNPQLSIGRAVRYVNGDYSYSTRVIKLTAQLDFPFEQSITIGNEKVKGNTQQLKEEVASANKDLNLLTVFNDMTQTIQQSYNRTQQMMLDGFAAIKNIWQLKTDANGNTYAFSAFDVVTQRGVTMYAEGGDLDIPSIYAGIPFDNKTIWINPETKKVEVIGGTGGGVADSVHWNNIEGKPSFSAVATSGNYADLSGLPDLRVYATTEYITAELKKYVTIDGNEAINGLKNFTKGLQIDGLGITKSQDDVIYLDANLVVRGGITMFGTNSVDVPTIMDAIATDGVNLKVVDGVLTFVGSSGGGLTEVYWDDVIGRPTLLSSFIDDVVSGYYLPLSGGKVTGQIEYNFDWGGNIPAAGAISFGSIDELPLLKSFIGNGLNTTYNKWVDIISVRADNGNSQFGMYLVTSMTDPMDSLSWNRQAYGTWQGERVILDSVNWSQYVTAADGGNYLPLSGGRISNSTTGLYINRTTEGANPHITFEVNGSRVGDLGIASHGEPAFYSYGMTGSTGWKRILYDGASTFELKDITISQDKWGNGIALRRTATGGGAGISSYSQDIFLGIFGIGGAGKFEFSNKSNTTVFNVNQSGDVLANGGITMYSDQRKKTILNHVELSLQQIADAPLIEHYYNSDEKRTTHVGSIAQYWAETIGNDWFCKLDSEGYYTMEIQNAALASAISVARELVKYESKTDRKIRLLKDRVKELEAKIEKLENN